MSRLLLAPEYMQQVRALRAYDALAAQQGHTGRIPYCQLEPVELTGSKLSETMQRAISDPKAAASVGDWMRWQLQYDWLRCLQRAQEVRQRTSRIDCLRCVAQRQSQRAAQAGAWHAQQIDYLTQIARQESRRD
jgi:hypothetical protein